MTLQKAHWVVPSLMIGGLVCGIAFALGHHFFYNSLQGRIVQSNSEQEWNIRIGTGMAFLVKTCLTAAAGFAYTQLLWTTLRSRHATLEGVDAMFSVATNAWDFLTLELWRKGFGLVLIAGILWTLPIIAVFTPAALTVQPSTQLNQTVHFMSLPELNFTSPYLFAQWGKEARGGYIAPSIAISRLVSSVASQGSILPMEVPFPNSSYSLTFYGPSLSCGPLGGSPQFHVAYDKTFADAHPGLWGQSNLVDTFISFVPQKAKNNKTGQEKYGWEDRTLSGLRSIFDTKALLDVSGNLATIDHSNGPGDPEARCRFFVIFPTYGSFANRTIECGLYNSSYDVDLKFDNGKQAIDIRNMTRLNPVGTQQTVDQANSSIPDVAYVSVMDSLGGMLMGYIYATRYGSLQPQRTQILSTVLTRAREMKYLDRGFGNDPASRGLGPDSTTANLTMAETLEQLVTNITLSLLSNQVLLRSPDNSTKGNITESKSQNEYSYNPRNLYAAYGAGIFATFAVVIVGLVCIAISSKSYRSTFSTILRTTRNEELDALVAQGETSGAEPLSKRLAKTSLGFRHRVAVGANGSSGVDSAAAAFMVVKGGKPVYEQVSQMQDSSSYHSSLPAREDDVR